MSKCVICYDSTYSSYYDALACDACRTFFRRQVLSGRELRCRKNNDCSITIETRRSCNACRFSKCLALGMKPNLVERESNRKRQEDILANLKFKLNSMTWNSNHSPFICAASCFSPKKPAIQSIIVAPPTVDSVQSTSNGIEKYDASHCLSLKNRNHSSGLQYKVLGCYELVCNQYDIVIQVPVVNGLIVGSQFHVADLIQNHARRDINAGDTSMSLTLDSRAQYQVFQRIPSDLTTVTISDFMNSSSLLSMHGFSGDHWTRLQQLMLASRFFREALEVFYHLPSDSHSDNICNEVMTKQLILSVTQDNLTKQISLGIECLDVFRKLSLDDQFIVVKEALLPVCFLVCGHSFDRSCDSFAFSAFGDKVMFCIHESTMMSSSYAEPMSRLYREFWNNFYEFLRKDFFVISILSMMCIFRHREGTSCQDIFNDERSFYVEILDKYIRGNVSSRQWPSEYNLIWRHIDEWMDHVEKIISVYSKFACDQEKALKSNNHHESS